MLNCFDIMCSAKLCFIKKQLHREGAYKLWL